MIVRDGSKPPHILLYMKRYILFLTVLLFVFPLLLAGNGEDDPPAPFTPRIVKVQSETEVDSLESEGVEILRRRGHILLCLFPNVTTRSAELARYKPRPIAPTLDVARGYYDAGSVQTGAAVGIPYTGKGVVVGICDIGIDPLHPTFLDADGRSRIRRVVQYVEREGIRIRLDGDDEYREWVTDNPDECHATHVCGILAGGGAGTPYVGIASDADIVVTVSTLTDVGILAGVEDIIDYAKEVGKPAVINLSLGSYTGAHDGSSLCSQYLDMCADDAIIVLSAGNEGSNRNTLISDFSSARSSVSFLLGNKAWDQFRMYGVTDIWSGTASPLSVSLGLYDTDERKVVEWLDPFLLTGYDTLTCLWGGEDADPDSFPFEGELMAVGYVDTENGRHCTSLGYEFMAPEQASLGKWARYMLAVRVTGNPDDDVEVYADGTYTRLAGLSGSPVPTPVRSISDLACGFNVISVGMYGNRDSIPFSIAGESLADEVGWRSTGYKEGATVLHSSYGTLRDGRVMPLTVAPGATLMSAGSRPYLSEYPDERHLISGDTSWLDKGGTSMSAPYVAGYIATWLEAVPTLTAQDVRRIIAECNRLDIPEPDDPHNGAGYFDPVAGLRLVLQVEGVESPESGGALLAPNDYVEVYDVAGVRRYAGAVSGLSGMQKGLYVVKSRGSVRKMALPVRL